MPQDQSWRPTHRNGTAVTDPVKVSCARGRGFRLRLRNLNATAANSLDVSFDSGNTWYSIPGGTEFVEDVSYHYFYVRRGASTDVAYAALLLEG